MVQIYRTLGYKATDQGEILGSPEVQVQAPAPLFLFPRYLTVKICIKVNSIHFTDDTHEHTRSRRFLLSDQLTRCSAPRRFCTRAPE